MDDYNLSTIIESKNEWCARLTNILTPCIIEGIKSVFSEAHKICQENDEDAKYLMTFQNFLNNIPKWSSEIVETEKQRIITSSACNYLDDLLSCVHITQLKSLTCTRVGLKQKKINIDIPNLNGFIHKVYINTARKVYVNVYLFEKDIMPLLIQKNNRELELIVKECILNTIRESIPIENILRIYLDETQETDVEVEEKKEVIPDKEAIEKHKKTKEKKELDKIKKEVEEKSKKENKNSLKKSLQNASKDINKDNLDDTILKKTDDVNESDNESESESESSKSNTSYTNESDLESEASEDKLVISNNSLDNISNLDLDIKSLDEDPDKLNLDVLDLDVATEPSDESIKLDIEELS
jgi:hypothetical protein